MLVNDADTREILHANPPLPGFAEGDLTSDDVVGSLSQEHEPRLAVSELASLLEEVALTGRPRHLPEFCHDVPGQGPRWWSASSHRIDTDHWGTVVVTLTVELTDQVAQVGANQIDVAPADDQRRCRPKPRVYPPAGC